MICSFPGCDDEARPGGSMCDMHAKRGQRGRDMHAPKREKLDPWGRLVTAAIELADADSDDDSDYNKREARLRSAARRWAGVIHRHSNR